MRSTIGRRARGREDGVGISLAELAEESRFGDKARREVIRWFPASRWVVRLHADPALRELALIDRRRFLRALGIPLIVGVGACSGAEAQLVFQAILMLAQYYLREQASEGNALFDNGSQSRESFQLLTTLHSGTPESQNQVQDENLLEVNVPATTTGYMHFFGGLHTTELGSHYVSGLAAGETRNSEVYEYRS